jgi:predicted HicB family RNase H-like nuclease
MSMLIDPELHRAFKVAAAAQGTTMTDVLVTYIRSYVEKYSPSARPMKKGGRA